MIHPQLEAMEANYRRLLLSVFKIRHHLKKFEKTNENLINVLIKPSHLCEHIRRLKSYCNIAENELKINWPNLFQSYKQSWEKFLSIRRFIHSIEDLGIYFSFKISNQDDPVYILDSNHIAHCNCVTYNDFWPNLPLCISIFPRQNTRRSSI